MLCVNQITYTVTLNNFVHDENCLLNPIRWALERYALQRLLEIPKAPRLIWTVACQASDSTAV